MTCIPFLHSIVPIDQNFFHCCLLTEHYHHLKKISFFNTTHDDFIYSHAGRIYSTIRVNESNSSSNEIHFKRQSWQVLNNYPLQARTSFCS